MARPTENNPDGEQISPKFTPETIQKLEYAFLIDSTVEEACFYANISPSTFYGWQKENPKLMERFDALRNNPVFKARESVIGGLHDPELALKYLERKKPKEFGTKTQLGDSLLGPLTIQIIRADGSSTTTDNKTS